MEDPDLVNSTPNTPFLLFGETTQGFMTVKHQEDRVMRTKFKSRTIESMQLIAYL